jgi:hypothetical protein
LTQRPKNSRSFAHSSTNGCATAPGAWPRA